MAKGRNLENISTNLCLGSDLAVNSLERIDIFSAGDFIRLLLREEVQLRGRLFP
jgi:hypothetical protein